MRIYGKYEKVKAKFRQQHDFHAQPVDPKGCSMTYTAGMTLRELFGCIGVDSPSLFYRRVWFWCYLTETSNPIR